MFGDFSLKYKALPVQLKATIWFLICSFLQRGISVITTPIFTRLMNTTEYGNYNVFQSWLGIITIIVSLQLSAGVYTQGLIKFSDNSKVFSSALEGLTFSLTLIWTGIYALFHTAINKLTGLTTVQMLLLLLIVWTTSVYNFWSAEQRVDYKYKMLVAITLIASVLQPVLGIGFVLLAEDKVTARILAMALVNCIAYTGLFIKQLKSGKKFYDSYYWKYSLAFNLPLVPHYLSQTVLNNADRIMIKNMIGSSEAGIYGLAYSISLIMTLFNLALTQTLSPWIYDKIKNKRVSEISGISYLCLIIIAVVNILLIAIAPEAVAVFAPKDYYAAIWVIPPVAMSAIFMFSYDLFAKFEFYYEKTKFIMLASIGGAVLNILLNWIFLNKFGFLAAAYTTLICYILYAFAHYLFMLKVCMIEHPGEKVYDSHKLLLIYVVFIFAGFVFMSTYSFPVVRYTLIIILATFLAIKRNTIKSSITVLLKIRNKQL